MACCSLTMRWIFRRGRKWSCCCVCGNRGGLAFLRSGGIKASATFHMEEESLDGGEFARGGRLEDVGAVERVALRWLKACIGDDPAKFFFVGAARDTRGVYHVFLNQHAADIVGAKLQTHLANLDARREPTRLDVIDVVEVQAADRERLQGIGGRGCLHLLCGGG